MGKKSLPSFRMRSKQKRRPPKAEEQYRQKKEFQGFRIRPLHEPQQSKPRRRDLCEERKLYWVRENNFSGLFFNNYPVHCMHAILIVHSRFLSVHHLITRLSHDKLSFSFFIENMFFYCFVFLHSFLFLQKRCSFIVLFFFCDLRVCMKIAVA